MGCSNSLYRYACLCDPRNLLSTFTYSFQLALRNAEDGKNEPRARWKRTVHLVSRLHNGSETTTTSKIQQKAEMELKVLETQHWLELTDRLVHSYHHI